MAAGKETTARTSSAALIGLLATALVAAAHLARLDHRAELLALDFRFRHFSDAPDGNQIVHLDIDDTSLEKLGRWPWPRRRLAGILDVLRQAGARAVALDIIMPEPQEVRFDSDLWDARRPEAAGLIERYPPLPVLDDLALAAAIARGGNVVIPMHIDPNAPVATTPLERKVAAALATRPAAGADELAGELHAAGEERFGPAYLRERSLAALERFSYPLAGVEGIPLRTGRIIPPLFLFARRTRTTGFVTFAPDVDGTVRRIPLLLRAGRRVYPQFALALAADLLGARRGGVRTVRAGPRAVHVAFADGTDLEVPTDEEGMMLINWQPDAAAFHPPRHIRAFVAGEIWREQRKLDALAARRPLYVARILEAAQEALADNEPLANAYFDLAEKVGAWSAARAARARARLELHYATLLTPAPGRLEALAGQVEKAAAAETDARRALDAAADAVLDRLPKWLAALPASDARRANLERMLRELREDLPAEQARLRRFVAGRLAGLGALVRGKLVLIGSTATGAADFVPTPVAARLPGVVVHANIINTIVSGAFIRRAPPGLNAAVIAVLGALVSLLAARLPIVRAGLLSLLLVAGYVAANLLTVFAVLDCWLALVSPPVGAAAAFLVVTAYRQVTEERAKRHIRGLFAHALSPALVDQLLADPAQLDPTRRQLSCFFSDLASFTSMSDRLGEQGTVAVLRRYFDRMTEIIQDRYGGYLSKFLGDGILSFFGAPVPQPDHARRALAAAVACLDELGRLNDELVRDFGDCAHLACRIGIASGPVMFGDCGSSERSDYTAIGPHVNLASRLESANKQFGTRILVDENVWAAGDDGALLARPLGKVIVVGKPEPVAVWNVLGPRDDADDELRAAVGQFARAVELFARRRFAEAAELFETLLRRDGADRAAEMFLALCRRFAADPPGEDWHGAIELTEK